MIGLQNDLWAAAGLLFGAAAACAGVGLWIAILYALLETFKNFRLYSRHWVAARIRRVLFLRRQRALRRD